MPNAVIGLSAQSIFNVFVVVNSRNSRKRRFSSSAHIIIYKTVLNTWPLKVTFPIPFVSVHGKKMLAKFRIIHV